MKKYPVRLQDGIKEDIENIIRFKGWYSSSAPSRIVAKILDCLDDLAFMPYLGHVSDYDSDYRQISVEDYMIFYLVDEEREAIEVHYILHQSRNTERIVKTGDRSFEPESEVEEDYD